MRDVINLIEGIRDLLTCGLNKQADKAMAAAFVQVREMAASRLAAVAEALETGNEYLALQRAEIEPRLPNFIAQIGFPEEAQWSDYCRMHQLPFPPPLNQGTIQALQRLYMRGITRDSPFYHDCRAAIAAGDDERALQIIRSIVRLNPSDNEARQEMHRRLGLKLAPLVSSLRAALEGRNTEAALGWLEQIELLGAGPMLAQNDVYIAAISMRNAVTLHRAMAEVVELLKVGEAAQRQQNWKEVITCIQRVRKLEKDHGLTLSPEQQAHVGRLEDYVEWERIGAEKKAEFDLALTALLALADRVNVRLQSSAPLTANEARNFDTAMASAWARVEQFPFSIPDAERIHLEEIASSLTTRLTHKRRTARVKSFAILPVVLIVLGTMWASYVYSCAQNYARQLEELQRQGLTGAANRLILMITSTAVWGVTSMPFLKAKLEEVGQWTEAQTELLGQTELLLDDIEGWVDDNLEEMEPEVLMQKLEEATDYVKQLAADQALLPQNKLDHLRGRVQARFKSLQAENAGKARTKIGDLDKLVGNLDFSRPSSEIAATLTALETGIDEIATYEHPTIPALRLPPDVTESLTHLRGLAKTVAAQMAALAAAKSAMAAAVRLHDYKAALDSYSKQPFAEVHTADGILSKFPTEDDIAAALLFNGDPDAWRQAQEQVKTGYKLIPNDVVRDELARLVSIRDDPHLKASGAGKNLLTAARLSEVVDAAGERYTLPLIQIVDSVVHFPEGDPIIKACLTKDLYAIMKARGLAWGLHYCPLLAVDMAELDAILGSSVLRSADWKSAKVQTKFGAKLKNFFAAAAARESYFDLATAYQGVVAKVVHSGVQFAGYVDEAHDVHPQVNGVPPKELWGISEQAGGVMPVRFIKDIANADDLKALRKWSPLFRVPVELRQEASPGDANGKAASQ